MKIPCVDCGKEFEVGTMKGDENDRLRPSMELG